MENRRNTDSDEKRLTTAAGEITEFGSLIWMAGILLMGILSLLGIS